MSRGRPFFLTGKHQHVATPFHRKSNWRVFCTQQTKHRTVLLMKLANIKQDCILFPRLKIPYTPWMHRDAGSKSLWYNAMMTLLNVWPLHDDGSVQLANLIKGIKTWFYLLTLAVQLQAALQPISTPAPLFTLLLWTPAQLSSPGAALRTEPSWKP